MWDHGCKLTTDLDGQVCSWLLDHTTQNRLFKCFWLLQGCLQHNHIVCKRVFQFVHIYAYQMRSHPSCQLFFNNSPTAHTQASLLHPQHRALTIWLRVEDKSDDWSRVIWVAVQRKGDGGSCFDMSEIGTVTKTNDPSPPHQAHPTYPHFGLTAKSKPLCPTLL